MTAPDDLTKVLDELEIDITLHSHLDAYDPQQLRALVRIARAADALWHHMEDGADPCNGQETCPPMDRLRVALDALCNGGER